MKYDRILNDLNLKKKTKQEDNCDIAAAKVIVEETGGKVTNLFGNEHRYDKSIKWAIISNGKVHDKVIDIIKKYLEEM